MPALYCTTLPQTMKLTATMYIQYVPLADLQSGELSEHCEVHVEPLLARFVSQPDSYQLPRSRWQLVQADENVSE